MMNQSGTHLSLLLISAVSFLPPDHHRAGLPRAPKKTVSAIGLALAAPAETTGLVDIYPPLPLADQPPYLLLAILLLAVIVLAAVLVLFLRRRRSSPPPNPDPAAEALAELSDAQRLLTGSEPGRHATYAETVSSILRRYVELRFNLSATRRTTEEFLGSLEAVLEHGDSERRQDRLPPNNYRDDLHHCLQLCDLVKFAGLSPEPAGVDQLTRTVRSFIETTGDRTTPAEV
ncbi:DUF4381 family protein [Desulfofustis glycolicus]|uniref:Uncharacterized protein n=1 Tax=Desulfofustis glycolicus DSM 9705 TaxID=1121409 RepID=A0A1M5WK16_9BACT|nr:DUF4381 family protein [Desulfofustis glycolicus]MCB2216819.1 DUF4381 family protein [Desulfobulbaceae bacterium]SHH87453.1 protein of unknown function [Desulfofustis glycolicus DSM 9705]